MKYTTLKNTLILLCISFISAITAVFIFSKYSEINLPSIIKKNEQINSLTSSPINTFKPTDFTIASSKAIDAVVHVTVLIEREAHGYKNPFFDFFFGEQRQAKTYESMGSGSGVIISKDGYIVTNNHVIEKSKTIKVVLNDKRTYPAKLVGTDPLTDIALIKLDNIENDTFPTLKFGNSETLRIGEWVLAIGNPFNLSTTVTAGIVSAKGRNMYNMNTGNTKMNIESFIQTDAAVNSGNSGGALVNTQGELIGINTAIASPTGSYAGYSFAVPSTIVKKIVEDIIEYGEIKRAYLGISINDINKQLAVDEKLNTLNGVYINGLNETGAAKCSGIKKGDVIIKINDKNINSVSELQEQITRYHPGDVIKATILRGEDSKEFNITLLDEYGNSEIITNETLTILGANFSKVPDELKKSLGINEGIQIVKLNNGKLMSKGIKTGYIITKVNNQEVKDINGINNIINNANSVLFISGVYPNGSVAYYAINLEE